MLAAYERRGGLRRIVTQNVDGLHQAAGARSVIELHGNLAQVACLGCGELTTRDDLHRRLHDANPAFRPLASAINPDGDVDLSDEALRDFATVDCLTCLGGILKPDVVFFGETVPPDRVAAAYALVENANALLVLGSSLMVMSGRRFVIRAIKLGIPVAIVNQGVTRADANATLTIDAPLGRVLPELVTQALN
jgi:NAD-dependent SIR2 family protein deacetylase